MSEFPAQSLLLNRHRITDRSGTSVQILHVCQYLMILLSFLARDATLELADLLLATFNQLTLLCRLIFQKRLHISIPHSLRYIVRQPVITAASVLCLSAVFCFHIYRFICHHIVLSS